MIFDTFKHFLTSMGLNMELVFGKFKHFQLLELPKEAINQPLVIKGNDEHVILCTKQNSYRLKRVCTSNTLLVVNQSNRKGTIDCQSGDYFEAIRFKPVLGKESDLMASEDEMQSYYIENGAILNNENSYEFIPNDKIIHIVRLIDATMTDKEDPVVVFDELEEDLKQDLTRKEFEHVYKFYYKGDQKFLTSVFVEHILREKEKMAVKVFEQEFNRIAPFPFNPNLNLQNAFIMKDYIHYLELPNNFKDRIIYLFDLQAVWTRDSLLSYLDKIFFDLKELDINILKICRKFNQGKDLCYSLK